MKIPRRPIIYALSAAKRSAKNILCAALAAALLLTGCAAGVSREEYDGTVSALEAVQSQLDDLESRMYAIERRQMQSGDAESGGASSSPRPDSSAPDEPAVPDAPDDFFSDAARVESFKSLVEHYDFTGLKTLLDDYLSAKTISENDIVRDLSKALGNAPQLVKLCTIQNDGLDNRPYIYYAGVGRLSDTVNILPYIHGAELHTRIGFRQKEAIAFDQVQIKISNKEYASFYLEQGDTVVESEDGEVLEYTDRLIGYEEVLRIYSFEKPVITFENKQKMTKREHALSQAEKEALYTIYTLHQISRELADMCADWEAAHKQ